MTHWKKLEVYRPLQAEEISPSFKKFAHYIADELFKENFKLKESKTVKKFYRFTEDFEQAIYFETLSSKTDFRIKIAIKPLFSDPSIPYWILEAFEISAGFKMTYPLTREYLLLAEHLVEETIKSLIPFFDSYDSYQKVVLNHQNLLNYYRTKNGDITPEFVSADLLFYDSSFKVRDAALFNESHAKFLKRELSVYERFKDDLKAGKEILDRIQAFKQFQLIFNDDKRYKQEVEKLNQNSVDYLNSFQKKRSK
ncbi:hypothetical protein AY601_1901 [Pedobacter cryoconitis]|uniref:Uncharacterized protein n=1 Tax=Pedobacter cryoconitis TaxID=188932 RepID=A0A127VC66_9SPHI|nr:hypothetical protein [Pedobacter cryoconitis]AMP98809.1 hypothetical protein AY601_1901 [Pedobacter cryoconitis]